MTGYIIYYQQDGGQKLSQSAGPTDTTANITGLIKGASYSVTMASTTNTLSSTESEAETFTIGILLHVSHSIYYNNMVASTGLHFSILPYAVFTCILELTAFGT